MTYLALPNNLKKDNNQPDAEFDIGVFEWKENDKTVLIRRRSIEEGNKMLYFLLSFQRESSLYTKMKGKNGYDKAHNV